MIIVDNYIPQGMLLEQIQQDSLWDDNLPYSWTDKDHEPTTIWQTIASLTWKQFFPGLEYAGYEYWSNSFRADGTNKLDWHYDKDEHLFDTTKEVAKPIMGMVYYAHRELPSGGYLEIDHNGEIERIQPVPNRLIVFNPGIGHRVCAISSGVRRTFASNVWTKKPSSENFVG